MKKDTLSLREAAKLMQFAPATVKRMIKKGTLKATSTGAGRKRRYMIAAKDIGLKPNKPCKAVKPVKIVKTYIKQGLDTAAAACLKEAGESVLAQTRTPVGTKLQHFISEPFAPGQYSSAEQMLRQAFCGWVIEKVLSA